MADNAEKRSGLAEAAVAKTTKTADKKIEDDVVRGSKIAKDIHRELEIARVDTIVFMAAYLRNQYPAVEHKKPAAELLNNLVIGFGALSAADKATIRTATVEAQTRRNNTAVIAAEICDATWAGTTQQKDFYKTLATSLKDARLGENNEKDKKNDAVPVRYTKAAGRALVANMAVGMSVSKKKIAKASNAEAVKNTAVK